MKFDVDLSGGPVAVIDRAALRHNLGVVRNIAPHSKVMAVVKANAYGHGIVPVAHALIGADAFGVARLQEALALRDAGIGQPIVLLEGVFGHQDLDVCARLKLDIVVHSFAQLEALEQWRGGTRLAAWCKVDTGMNRLGFRVEDFALAWSRLNACVSVQPRPRVMTHLAVADERDDARTTQQLALFATVTRGLNAECSISNSAGLLAWPDARVDWLRPGLMLYGMSPFAQQVGSDLNLHPAMTLVTQLIAVRELRAGEEVGYGGAWHASRATRVGIAAIGYGDGYPRHARDGMPVCVRGREAAVIGRVSMDMIAIDVTAVADVQVGEQVVLWGEGLPAERVATYADTIPYELVCAINQRVAMHYR